MGEKAIALTKKFAFSREVEVHFVVAGRDD